MATRNDKGAGAPGLHPTAAELLELFDDPEAWKEWFNSLSGEEQHEIENLVAEFKRRKPINPIVNCSVGDPGETVNSCQQVLQIVTRAIQFNEFGNGPDDMLGFYIIIEGVRDALRYESERGLTTRQDNVTRLEGKS